MPQSVGSVQDRLRTREVLIIGSVTTASAAVLTDAMRNVAPDLLAGGYIEILNGAAAGDVRRVDSHTATVYTPNSNFSATLAIGDLYAIIHGVPGAGQGTALATEADTRATRNSADLPNGGARGILLRVTIANYTNGGGAPTFTPQISVKFPSGSYETYWTAGAALTANGTTTYLIYPGDATQVGAVTEKEDLGLPAGIFRVDLVVANGGVGDEADTFIEYMLVQ